MRKLHEFFTGKTVLVTGHTGFKGSWLTIWLDYLGAKVVGYSDEIMNNGNYQLCRLGERVVDYEGCITDYEKLSGVFTKHRPDIVFHLAAQPLVRKSYEQPLQTFRDNIIGTINVLECIRTHEDTRIGIMVTSDKCYDLKDTPHPYRESDPLGGHDPYSASKGCAEIAASSYNKSYFQPHHKQAIATVRSGNVIGGGDWSVDRIIPDSIRSIADNKKVVLRNPNSIRPWQFVLEPLAGYLWLAYNLGDNPSRYSGAWNFAPDAQETFSVQELVEEAIASYGRGGISVNQDANQPHEASFLTLDSTKAKEMLGWKSVLSFAESVELTVEWYKRYNEASTYELCIELLERYAAKAKLNSLSWAL